MFKKKGLYLSYIYLTISIQKIFRLIFSLKVFSEVDFNFIFLLALSIDNIISDRKSVLNYFFSVI